VIREKLAQDCSRVSELEHDRLLLRDPLFGRAEERRIIDSHLFELEMQDIDERIDAICRHSTEPADDSAS